MSDPDGPILALGVGNVLLRDDGVGVHAIRALERLAELGDLALPPGTSLVDGGTLGLGLLPEVSNSRAVLLIDAADLGRAPGAVEVIDGDALRQARAGHVSHCRAAIGQRVGVDDLLATAQLMGTLPEAVALVGVQPGEIAIGLELTELVGSALPTVVQMALDELWRLEAVTRSSKPGSIAQGREVAGATA
jgi:hydrogenase maturation protease